MSTQSNNCPCPDGYTLDPSNGTCTRIVASAPTLSSTVYTVVPGSLNGSYGSLGVNFYDDITARPYPIVFAPPTAFVDNLGAPLGVINTVTTSSLWGYSSAPGPPYYGRLNNCGVWTGLVTPPHGDVVPLNEWIGFSTCVTVTEAQTYCIGMAADNMCRFKINGQLIVDLSYIPGNYTWTFNKWHVFPITLPIGTYIIEMEGLNVMSDASFGAEIYKATPYQLATITTPTALAAVTIFSTVDQIKRNFQTGQNSGYSCPGTNCVLNFCSTVPVCNCLETIPQPICCFQLTNCLDQSVIITNTDISSSIGGVVNLVEYPGCWQVTSAKTCNGSVPVTTTTIYRNCQACLPCYKLTNCANGTQFVSTLTDLSSYIGQIVQIAGYPKVCWTVSSSYNCENPILVQVVNSYPAGNCPLCLCQYYQLTDCSGVASPIITNTDLSAYLGQVIQIKDCDGTCWTVACAATTIGAVPIIFSAAFGTCDLCNPPVIVPAPELLRQRKVRPGYNTPGCSVEYTERINCKFASQLFDLVKKRRYGITTCKEDDLDRYVIKKKLLDLRAIWDPALCNTCAPITCCTPCPVVIPVPPVPLPCPLATNVAVTITLITPCGVVDAVTDVQIIFNKDPRGQQYN